MSAYNSQKFFITVIMISLIFRNDSQKPIVQSAVQQSNQEMKLEEPDEVDGQNDSQIPSTNNKENAKPSSDFVLRNRKNCSLLTVSFESLQTVQDFT